MSGAGGEPRVEVAVLDRQRAVRVDRARIERLAARTLGRVGRGAAQVAVVLVGERRIRDLNRRWRGVDRATDVLAFAQHEGAGAGLHPEVLGDVVICVPAAVRQGREAGHGTAAEIDLLVVHGLLHLAGHEHEGDPAGGRAMRRLEREILRGVRR